MKSPFWEQSYTALKFPPSKLNLKPEDSVLMGGSCFAQELQGFLAKHFVDQHFIPTGITYNPLSLSQGLALLRNPELFQENQAFEHQGLWSHDQFHGSTNRPEKMDFLEHVEADLCKANQYLQSARLLVLTLGTAWAFKRTDNGQVVNNCHRRPGNLFTRELLSLQEMKVSLLHELLALNRDFPELDVVITVSPVRYLNADGRENSLSKARLICLAQELAMEHSFIHYFPSFEIVMDELRDYRWFRPEKLTHLNSQAISYIMERFLDWAGSKELQDWIPRAEKLRKRLNHRLEDPDSAESIKFQEDTEAMVDELSALRPGLGEFLNHHEGIQE